MFRSSLCDYNDAYILVQLTITVAPTTTTAPNNANKKLILKNCVPYTNCISRINNTQVDDAHDNDVVISMYNLIEYRDNYSRIFYDNIVEIISYKCLIRHHQLQNLLPRLVPHGSVQVSKLTQTHVALTGPTRQQVLQLMITY